jgi:hypothetical protein
MPEDIQYNLSRIEGQIARIESLIGSSTFHRVELCNVLKATKQFLADLRLALDPHRIDVA